jgi:hypothetical protein
MNWLLPLSPRLAQAASTCYTERRESKSWVRKVMAEGGNGFAVKKLQVDDFIIALLL